MQYTFWPSKKKFDQIITFGYFILSFDILFASFPSQMCE